MGLKARTLARRLLPRTLVALLSRLERRWHVRRFEAARTSPTDYRFSFDYRSLRKAKASILWYDDWRRATRATLAILERSGLIRDGATVVDYGCGVGRMTRALVERHRLRVLAVDRSAQMRRHARRYLPGRYLRSGVVEILSDAELLHRYPAAGAVDAIFAIEVLQHVPEPILDELLPRLLAMLMPSGRLFVLGNESLDVDRSGSSGSPVAPVLARHARIERDELWTEGFAHPRRSFTCARLAP
jgi:SAM-dependent methyltransferase